MSDNTNKQISVSFNTEMWVMLLERAKLYNTPQEYLRNLVLKDIRENKEGSP